MSSVFYDRNRLSWEKTLQFQEAYAEIRSKQAKMNTVFGLFWYSFAASRAELCGIRYARALAQNRRLPCSCGYHPSRRRQP